MVGICCFFYVKQNNEVGYALFRFMYDFSRGVFIGRWGDLLGPLVVGCVIAFITGGVRVIVVYTIRGYSM